MAGFQAPIDGWFSAPTDSEDREKGRKTRVASVPPKGQKKVRGWKAKSQKLSW
jgi:hypothetical protein